MSTKCKVKVLRHLEGVFPELQPEVGKIYDADYVPRKHRSCELFCVIDVKDKRIVLKRGEFEVVG